MNQSSLSPKRGTLIASCLMLLSLPGFVWAESCSQQRIELLSGSQTASITLPPCAKIEKFSADTLSGNTKDAGNRQQLSGKVEILIPGPGSQPIVLRADSATIVTDTPAPTPGSKP